MNIQATHGFTIGGSRKSDDDRVTGMVAEAGVLAPVAATAREKHVAFAVVFLSILALAAIIGSPLFVSSAQAQSAGHHKHHKAHHHVKHHKTV